MSENHIEPERMVNHAIPANKRFVNLTGQKFGRLLAVGYVGRKSAKHSKMSQWKCRCDCGQYSIVYSKHLKSGASKSCGCLFREVVSDRSTTHGATRGGRTPEYNSWCQMVKRCTNTKDAAYSDYGGRGITVCDRWRNSFENFLSDMGKRPSLEHSIDRIDNNGSYEPGNCRWATRKEQCRNRRNNRMLTFNGMTMCVVDWAAKIGILQRTLTSRIRYGWSVEDCLTKPLRAW